MQTVDPSSVTRYPLSWPTGWKRSLVKLRTNFKTGGNQIGLGAALDRLAHEMHLLGGVKGWLISTNQPLTRNGWPRADRREPGDVGAALYFTLNGQARCLACDRYDTVGGNVAALAAHVEATRAIARYGVGTLDQAFAGYAMLPPGLDWRKIFGFSPAYVVTMPMVEEIYRAKLKESHPDIGGSHEDVVLINRARDAAREELGA